ncbi:rubredoxin [Clostridiales bacterium PH28_bin88]|nr:rubredoxin [Clostridiales bacterium PH28_bin88]
MWKCTVCGYVHDGDEAPERCPKCGVPKEKFERLPEEKANPIERSRFTNQLLAALMGYAEELEAIADEGLEDNLDPGCKGVFTYVKRFAREMGQMAKAEIQAHIQKGKWG